MQSVTKREARAALGAVPRRRQPGCSADSTCNFNQGSPPARGTLAPHAAAPDGCVVRRTPARSARAARGRGPRKLPVSGAPYERAAAPRRSDAGGLVGRSWFSLPRAARRDRGRRRTTISCLHEKRSVAAGTVDDAEWRPHVVGVRCGRLRSAWAGCSLCLGLLPALPPCGVVWLPDGVCRSMVRRRSGLFARVGRLFGDSRAEYVHFSKTYL